VRALPKLSRAGVLPIDTAGCCVISEELALVNSATGRISGDNEAGLRVCRGDWVSRVCVLLKEDRSGVSLELKSSCEKVTGEGAARNCSV